MSDIERKGSFKASEEPEVEGHGLKVTRATPDEPREGSRTTDESEVEGFGMKVSRATPDEHEGPDEGSKF